MVESVASGRLAVTPGDSGERLEWMDSVRGTAILLLLIWHASAVPEMLGLPVPDAVRQANAFFLPFRMPTLMFLSGLVLTKSLRKPLPDYYAGKLAMIVWPYVVWVLIAKVVFLDIEGMPWWHWRAWYATSYLWFLFFIGVYYAIAPGLARLPRWLPVAGFAILGVLLPHQSMEQRLAHFAVFFFLGFWFTSRPGWLRRLTQPRLLAFWLVPAVGAGVASVLWTEQLQYAVVIAPFSLAGILALIGVCAGLPTAGRALRHLRGVGRASLVYYVSHFPVMVLATQALGSNVGPLPLAAVNLAIAVSIGAVLVVAKRHRPWVWLFQGPDALTRFATARLDALFTTLHKGSTMIGRRATSLSDRPPGSAPQQPGGVAGLSDDAPARTGRTGRRRPRRQLF